MTWAKRGVTLVEVMLAGALVFGVLLSTTVQPSSTSGMCMRAVWAFTITLSTSVTQSVASRTNEGLCVY